MNKKFFLTAASVTVFILILVLLLSPKKNSTPAPSEAVGGVGSNIVPINLSKEKRDAAMVYTASIEHKLPLVDENFPTSVGINTSIRLSRADFDPAEIVHLDINGLSYINKDELDEKNNPDLTAFKESYLRAIDLLEGQNIDPKRLIFVFGDKQYMQTAALYWIDQLGLSK